MSKKVDYFNYFPVGRDFNFRSPSLRKIGIVLGVLVLILFGSIGYSISAPKEFAVRTIFTVKNGQTLDQIATALKSKNYIRSAVVFKTIVRGLFLKGNGAVAGAYTFNDPQSAFSLGFRIVSGDFDLRPVKITIPEGLNKFETANLLVERLPELDKNTFLNKAPEGYLFPDTYFFAPNVTSEEIIKTMRDNFDEKVKVYDAAIKQTGRSFSDVITMASIVETEARQFETRQTIADILWRRLDEKMPLQVDVTFKYVNGKTTADLTLKDLNIDSPYNSYRYKGLPPTPIANPGLNSILATITPKDTKYYFFLSDTEGVMHFARTFEEHKKNKQTYLR